MTIAVPSQTSIYKLMVDDKGLQNTL